MSRVIPGIQGRPFRKIVDRTYWGNRTRYVTEVLSCGHKNTVEAKKTFGATKRRCYHADCKITT